jgi:hypothetical protein
MNNKISANKVIWLHQMGFHDTLKILKVSVVGAQMELFRIRLHNSMYVPSSLMRYIK